MAKDIGPRISVNKLAEYVVSKGGRQRQILRDQKYPQDFKGMYYKEATEAISSCIASNLEDMSGIERALRLLEQATPEKVGTQRRINANIDAIETFLTMQDEIDLMGATASLGSNAPPKLKIMNVDVSVRPDVVLRGTGKSGKKLVGAIKLHFPRTFPLHGDASGYVSAVTQEYCKAYLVNDEEVFAPYCFVIDIGSKTVCPGAKAITNRLKDIQAECKNIVGLWPTITPTE